MGLRVSVVDLQCGSCDEADWAVWAMGGVKADGATDVDEAVRAQKRDRTGGRGINGKISNQLEGAKGRETLESAV